MSEEERKTGKFQRPRPGLLATQLLQQSRLKPGEVAPIEREHEEAATSVVNEAIPVQEPTGQPVPRQPVLHETTVEQPPASSVTVIAPSLPERRTSKLSDTRPRRIKPSQRPDADTIIRRRNASLVEGRQVAVRLSLATTQEIDAICQAIKQVSGFKDPLLDAEFARVAIEFLLRVLRSRHIDLAQAYTDIATRYSLRLGETRVETVLLEYLEEELPDLLRDE